MLWCYTHTPHTHRHVQVWSPVTKEAPAAALALDGAEVKAVHQHRVTLCPESFTVALLLRLRRTSCAAAAAGSCGGAWLAEGRSLSHNGAGMIGDEGSAIEGDAALVTMLSPPAIGGNDRHQVGSSVAL